MSEIQIKDDVKNADSDSRIFVYDADAQQRIGLTLTSYKPGGPRRVFNVTHILRGMTDDEFYEYEERKKVIQQITGGDILNVRTDDDSLQAAAWLWDRLAIGREGYIERPDWKERTNILDQQTAIEKGLLAVYVVNDESEVVEEAADELVDDDYHQDSTTVVILECYFNESIVQTTHYLKPPTAKDVADFEKIMKRVNNLIDSRRGFRQRKPVAKMAIPSKARELAQLYDRLIIRTEGYAGRVPAHHKRDVVLELFNREAEVREKN